MSSGISDERLLDLYKVKIRIKVFKNSVRHLINECRTGHMSFTGGDMVVVRVTPNFRWEINTCYPLSLLSVKGADLKSMMEQGY